MSLAGQIGEISFSDVVQLCARIKCTGTLVLSSLRTGKAFGHFGFEAGELVDGQLDDMQGLEAVYRALRIREAAYRFDHDLRSQQRRIFTPISMMLVEGLQHTPAVADEVTASDGAAFATDGAFSAFGPNDPTPGLIRSPLPLLAMQEPQPGGPNMITTPTDSKVEAQPPMTRRPMLAAIVASAIGLAVLAVWMIYRGRPVPSEPASGGGETAAATAGTAGSAERAAAPARAAVPGAPPVAPGTVQGITDNQITFGMAAPFSGSAKELGRQMKLGIETAFASVNAAGGVHGRRLRLVAVDDGYEPTRTADAMKQLFDGDRVFGILGNVGTPTAVVALPMALERRTLFFGAFTGASLLRRDPPDRYVFNYRASYGEETAAVVNYLVKVRHLRPEHIAVFAQEDAFGDAGYAGVVKAMRALRPDLRPAPRFGYKRNTVDVAEAVARLRDRAVPVRAVIMVATYRAAAKLIEKVRDTYPNMIFTNVSFVGSTALADELTLLGPRYAKGVIVTQVVPPVSSYSTAVLAYKNALERFAPGEKTDYVSLEGYWAANVLIEGLKRAGPKLDTERLVDTLEGIHELDLGIGTPISFALTEHQGSHKVWGTQLDESGHYQPVDLE